MNDGQAPGFGVSPEGQRFLYRDLSEETISFTAEATYAVVVENWLEKVRQMLPVTD